MAKKKKKNITRIHNPRNINVGTISFLMIFLYLMISVYNYVTRDQIKMYEVVEGRIVDDKTYTGLVLRQESVKQTDSAGYVNYYIREGKRASVGSCVYSIDETGQMKKFLDEHQSENTSISEEGLENLKRQLSSFSLSYDDDRFDMVYDVKYSLEAAVLEYANLGAMENLDALMRENGITFKQVFADQSGVVSYGIDGLEAVTPETVTKETFKKDSYSRTVTKAGQQIAEQTPVYKVVTSEEWNLIFEPSEEERQNLADQTSLKVSFPDHDLTLSGKFSLYTGADGTTFGRITFNKYMMEFLSDRFLEFEILSDQVTGLKIPISSVTSKEFFTVPKEYLTMGGDSSNPGFLREVYTADGTSAEFIPTTLYYETEDVYYIDKKDFAAGDYLCRTDSTECYQIGATASLQGVYNINKGYTVFKQIEVLTSNDKYYIVPKDMDYGLAVYDHIVLDATKVTEDQILYR